MAARQYKSTADSKTLGGSGVTSAGQTAITLSSITNLPPLSGSQTFTLVIGPDTATEEIVTVTSYGSGNVVNVTRGSDGTTAQSAHAVGAIVKHMITARDLQEPQDHIDASASVHGITGSVVGTTGTQELTNKTLGNSNNIKSGSTLTNNGTISGGNINGATLNAASTIGGVSGTTLAAEHAAWTAYTPTISGGTGTVWSLGTGGSAGTITGSYIQIGKVVHFKGSLAIGTSMTVGNDDLTITLPVASVAADSNGFFGLTGTGRCALTSLATAGVILPVQISTTAFIPQVLTGSTASTYGASGSVPRTGIKSTNYTKTASNNIIFSGTYEVA